MSLGNGFHFCFEEDCGRGNGVRDKYGLNFGLPRMGRYFHDIDLLHFAVCTQGLCLLHIPQLYFTIKPWTGYKLLMCFLRHKTYRLQRLALWASFDPHKWMYARGMFLLSFMSLTVSELLSWYLWIFLKISDPSPTPFSVVTQFSLGLCGLTLATSLLPYTEISLHECGYQERLKPGASGPLKHRGASFIHMTQPWVTQGSLNSGTALIRLACCQFVCGVFSW